MKAGFDCNFQIVGFGIFQNSAGNFQAAKFITITPSVRIDGL